MKNDANSFWNRVEDEWLKKNISKTEFCNNTNGAIKFGTWSNKKSLGIMPNLELATSFAKALGVSLDYLVTGEEYTDPLFAKLQENKELKQTCSFISMCSKDHLNIINTMLSSWGYIVSERNQTKGLA